ncbi:MAG: hypothetical protein HQL65_19860 [Magnetococcales bacterium]|nr:hypothetical protein [Magnetococcales bacterium]
MIELVAIHEEDGSAFVRTEDGLIVIRPPYHAWSRYNATESMVEQGIVQHGFTQAEGNFSDWQALIQHLKHVQIAAHKNRETTTINERDIENLIYEMPADHLALFLDRVEKELLPKAQWAAAEKLLTKMLGIPTLQQSKELNNRTLLLLERSQEIRKKIQEAADSNIFNSPALQFPHVSPSIWPHAKKRVYPGPVFPS